MLEPVLPAELVEARHAPLAVADEVERRRRRSCRWRSAGAASSRFCRNSGWFWSVKSAQPLAAHGERPVRQAPLPHRLRGLAAEGLHHRHLVADHVGVGVPLPVLDQVGNQGVQPVDGDELLREVERRAEMVDAAVDVIGVFQIPDIGLLRVIQGEDGVIRIHLAAQAEDARARGEDGVPLVGLLGVRRTCRSC